MLALRMEAVGLHPFHASAVRYRDKTVLFLGGESNHGKSMGQIEACRRGALLVSTETTVIDEDGARRHGLEVEPFLKKRTEGTERADKAAPERGRREVLRRRCRRGRSTPSRATSTSSSCPPSTATSTRRRAEMIPFERQFQTFHSLQNYFLLNELLAPGFADADRRHRRAARGAGRLRRAVRRAAVLLRPGRDAAGAPRRGGPGPLGPADASLRLRAARPRSTRPSRCSASTARTRGRSPAGRT